MDFIDYYKVLGIDKSASTDEIKKAYRKLARQHHPDLNPNDKEAQKKFQQINEANEILSHADNRKKYDKYGKDWKHAEEFEKAQSQRQRQSQRGNQSFTDAFDSEGYADFFASMFGGGEGGQGRGGNIKYRGQDYNAELHLNLDDILKTHQQTITVNGKNLRITIPAGIQNEQKIKLKGHGGAGVNGGPNGDLYISFLIADNERFKRLGDDFYTTHEIDLYTAVLGGETTIETLSGKLKIKVTPGTQNDSKIKLKAKGSPVYKQEGNFGNLIVTYKVKIPANLTEKQRDLFTQLSTL